MLIISPKAQIPNPKVQSLTIDRLKSCAIVCGSSLLMLIGLNETGLAQSSLIQPTPATCDLNLDLLKSNESGKDRNIVTADTVSAAGMTTPSLWWTSEQFSPKLVTNWIANSSQKQIYLLVDTQYWSILDYIDRYRTIYRFGHTARDYGYNLKICNSQKIALAEYTCDSKTDPQVYSDPNQNNNCQIWVNTTGQNGLGVQSK